MGNISRAGGVSASNPMGNDMRDFHTYVKQSAVILPADFMEKYNEAVSKKGARGRSTGKRTDLQHLAKWWKLSKKMKEDLCVMWSSAWFKAEAWNYQTDEDGKDYEEIPWGTFCGFHLSEQAAEKALENGEAEKIKNPKPPPEFLYKRWVNRGFHCITSVFCF